MMRNTNVLVTAAIILVLAITPAGPRAEDQTPLPEEARKRLDYTVGRWQSETHYLDGEGKTYRTEFTEDHREYVLGDRVVAIVGQIDGGTPFIAWEYYDFADGTYALTSVSRRGQLFTMRGDLEAPFRWTGERSLSDGTTILMRFTHTDIEPQRFTALGELSRDGGKTWRAFSRQQMTRIGE